jgi:hypothetical protein
VKSENELFFLPAEGTLNNFVKGPDVSEPFDYFFFFTSRKTSPMFVSTLPDLISCGHPSLPKERGKLRKRSWGELE